MDGLPHFTSGGWERLRGGLRGWTFDWRHDRKARRKSRRKILIRGTDSAKALIRDHLGIVKGKKNVQFG